MWLLLLLSLLNSTASQVPLLSITPQEAERGNCAPVQAFHVRGLFTQVYGHLIGDNEIVVDNYVIQCQSRGREKDTVSAVTISAQLRCRNEKRLTQPCSSIRNSKHQHTFYCQKGTNQFLPGNNRFHDLRSLKTARVTQIGECSTCSSTGLPVPDQSSSGCSCML
jgi:hypothetical protein